MRLLSQLFRFLLWIQYVIEGDNDKRNPIRLYSDHHDVDGLFQVWSRAIHIRRPQNDYRTKWLITFICKPSTTTTSRNTRLCKLCCFSCANTNLARLQQKPKLVKRCVILLLFQCAEVDGAENGWPEIEVAGVYGKFDLGVICTVEGYEVYTLKHLTPQPPAQPSPHTTTHALVLFEYN